MILVPAAVTKHVTRSGSVEVRRLSCLEILAWSLVDVEESLRSPTARDARPRSGSQHVKAA